MLRHGALSVDAPVSSWESSEGTVVGVRVSLAAPAAELGGLRRAPGVLDALHAALARAVARTSGHALHTLRLTWDGTREAAVAHGYRDAEPAPRISLEQGLAAFLEAAGEPELADVVATSRVRVAEGAVTLVPINGVAAMFARDAQPRLEEAARALLGPDVSLEVP